MARVAGKVAIVIGAAQAEGIGAAIAERLAEEGALVTVADIDAATGAATAAALARRWPAVRFRPVDVASPESNRALAEAVLAEHGRIDILCQNAGIFPYTMLDAIPAEEWDRVLGVNLRGPFLALQACQPAMRRQRYGRVVFTASITGPRVSSPGHAHYSASKAGILGLIRAAALENAAWGITVNGVEPGNVLTGGMRTHRSPEFIREMERSVPLGRLGTPRDVAEACLYLASDEAAYVTGTSIVIDGGQTLPEAPLPPVAAEAAR
ncbi:MAG: SDR family oxidoreductase [Dongiaceae bacterium]